MGGLLFDFLCTYEKNVKLLLESAVGDISFQKYIIVYNDPEIKKIEVSLLILNSMDVPMSW